MAENFHCKDVQFLKERAYFLRYSFIEELDKHLLGFESQLLSHNINVRWIENEEKLCTQIINSLPKKNFNKVCFDTPNIPEKLTKSNHIRLISIDEVDNNQEEFDSLIVQANFGISDTGNIVFIDKSSRNCFNKVNNLIIILNIDQILVKQSDLSFILSLLDYSNEEESRIQDIKIINAPFKHVLPNIFHSSTEAANSTEEVKIYVFLYDNGITNILQDSFLRQSLYCIHCGKCVNVCPVAKDLDGIFPIDLVKMNCFDYYNHTPFIFSHTTLCGNCAEVCPIHIPLVDLLICEMQMVNTNRTNSRSKQMYNIFSKREKMNKYDKCLFNLYFVRHFYGKNKILHNYFNNVKKTFFNLSFHNLDHNYNEDLKPEDITKQN